MADHIPFVSTEDGAEYAAKHYPDSMVVRIPLDRADRLNPLVPVGCKTWLDTCIDGLADLSNSKEKATENSKGEIVLKPTTWFKYMNQFPHFESVGNSLATPKEKEVTYLVHTVLDTCAEFKPAWISIPQIPFMNGSERNKINRMMASAAGKWRTKGSFHGEFILPLVFTKQSQVNSKTARNYKVEQAHRCYHEGQCDGYWAVECSLDDESGSGTLEGTRIPGVISLHQELNLKLSSKIRIAGPYWGLNLLLWARRLVDYPAIGLGTSYRYFYSRSGGKQPDARVPLPSLRRRAKADLGLKAWLVEAISMLGPEHPFSAEMSELLKNFTLMSGPQASRDSMCKFYKAWFGHIANSPEFGRSAALFQDLASVFALGRPLPDITSDKTHRPEAIAQSLMTNCL